MAIEIALPINSMVIFNSYLKFPEGNHQRRPPEISIEHARWQGGSACMYMYMYVCMHVCACMRMYAHVCMYACMHACMDACMDVCMYVCMHACMYASYMVSALIWGFWGGRWPYTKFACFKPSNNLSPLVIMISRVENNNYLKPTSTEKTTKSYRKSSFNLGIDSVSAGIHILWDSRRIN